MGEKRTVIYKLERHKWPDEIEAEKKARRRKLALVCSCLLFFVAGFFVAKGTQGTVVSGEASAEMEKCVPYLCGRMLDLSGQDKECEEICSLESKTLNPLIKSSPVNTAGLLLL